MERCIHGMNRVNCAHCTGFYTQKEEAKREKNVEKQTDILHDAVARFESYGEKWNDDECYFLFTKFEGGRMTLSSKEGRKAIREVSKSLGRTRKSVIWHYRQLFVLEGLDAHAGKIILNLKEDSKGEDTKVCLTV